MTPIPSLPAICPPRAVTQEEAVQAFKASVEHVLQRQGFGSIAFTCDGQELLVAAQRGRCTLGAVYDLASGRALMQDAWEDSAGLHLALLEPAA